MLPAPCGVTVQRSHQLYAAVRVNAPPARFHQAHATMTAPVVAVRSDASVDADNGHRKQRIDANCHLLMKPSSHSHSEESLNAHKRAPENYSEGCAVLPPTDFFFTITAESNKN